MLLHTERIVAAFAGHGTGHRTAGVAASLHILAMRGIVPSPMRQPVHPRVPRDDPPRVHALAMMPAPVRYVSRGRQSWVALTRDQRRGVAVPPLLAAAARALCRVQCSDLPLECS